MQSYNNKIHWYCHWLCCSHFDFTQQYETFKQRNISETFDFSGHRLWNQEKFVFDHISHIFDELIEYRVYSVFASFKEIQSKTDSYTFLFSHF